MSTPSVSAPVFVTLSSLIPREKDPRWVRVAKVIACITFLIPFFLAIWDLACWGCRSLSSKNVVPLSMQRPRSNSAPSIHPPQANPSQLEEFDSIHDGWIRMSDSPPKRSTPSQVGINGFSPGSLSPLVLGPHHGGAASAASSVLSPLALGSPARLSSHATVSSSADLESEFEMITSSPSMRPQPTPSKLLPIQQLLEKLAHLFFVPENPQKEFKYRYALDSMYREIHTYCNLNTLLKNLKTTLGFDPEVAYTTGTIPTEFPFAANAYCALRALSNKEGYQGIRQQYAHFLYFLRQALNQMNDIGEVPAHQSARELLLNICYAKYAKVEMYPHLQAFVLAALNKEMPTLNLSELAREIHSANEQLRNAEAQFKKPALARDLGDSGKLWGAIGLGGFDPTATSNTPYVHSIRVLKNGRKVTVLRHGTPTADKTILAAAKIGLQWLLSFVSRASADSIQPEVIPEYRALLQSLNGKNILYVNHQMFSQNHTTIGESARSHALIRLEKEHPNFHCLCLPMDGKFWKASYLDKLSLSQLKKDLLDALILETDGFRLPQQIKARHEKLRAYFTEVLDAIHENYFSNSDEFPIEKKWAFTMLFFSEIEDSFIDELNIHYMNASCKDDKDRGNARKIGNAMKHAMLLGKENDQKVLREIFILALAPYIIKNEEIVEHRLEMGLSVIELIASLSDAQKSSIRNHPLIGCKLLEQRIPKDYAPQYALMSENAFISMLYDMEKAGYEETFSDWTFESDCAAVYCKEGVWDLSALKNQILKDLDRIFLQLQGRRLSTKEKPQDPEIDKAGKFQEIIEFLGLSHLQFESVSFKPQNPVTTKALNYLSMLHQGSTLSAAGALFRRFAGNIPVHARQSSGIHKQNVFPTQISTRENGELEIVQYFELMNEEDKFRPIPVKATIVVHGDHSATITWKMEYTQRD